MMKTATLLTGALASIALLSGNAFAADITNTLVNPGFENTSSTPGASATFPNALIDGWDEPSAGIPGGAKHSELPRTGPVGFNPGNYFAYFDLGGAKANAVRFGDVSSETFAANMVYTFSAYGTEAGAMHQLTIGYNDDGDNFVALASGLATATTANAWSLIGPAVYTTGTSGDELGRNIVVYFGGPDATGGSLWVDDVRLDASAVPEPGSLALVGLGALAALRRRRRA